MDKFDIFSHPAVPFEVAAYCRQHRLTVYAQKLRKALLAVQEKEALCRTLAAGLDREQSALESIEQKVKEEVGAVLGVMKDAGQTK